MDELVKRLQDFAAGTMRDEDAQLAFEAADAIEKLTAYVALYKDCGETAMKVANDYKARIEELQAAKCPHYIRNVHDRGDDSLCRKWVCEVKDIRKRGKWTLHKDGSATCSVCGFVQNSAWDLDNWDNFCHHCGADMR